MAVARPNSRRETGNKRTPVSSNRGLPVGPGTVLVDSTPAGFLSVGPANAGAVKASAGAHCSP